MYGMECQSIKFDVNLLVYYSDLRAIFSNLKSCSRYDSSYDSGNHFMDVFPTIISTVFFNLMKTFSFT